MKAFLAERFGSFFLYPVVVMLLGAIILGTGCGSTPDPVTNDQADGEVKLFYSSPEGASEGTIVQPTPAPETVATIGENAPSDQPEILPSPGVEYHGYLISPNDLLGISILGEDDLSIIVRVSENGSISFPLLGIVKATGYTPIQFERKLESLLEKDYLINPSVNINIREYSTISVLGQVKKPGTFEIQGRLTVTHAIALAGGLTNISSPNGTKVIRRTNGEKTIIPIRLKDIMGDGDISKDILLKPGDLIVVPESFF